MAQLCSGSWCWGFASSVCETSPWMGNLLGELGWSCQLLRDPWVGTTPEPSSDKWNWNIQCLPVEKLRCEKLLKVMPVLLRALTTPCKAPCALSINYPLTWNHNAALLIMDSPENLFKPWLGLGQVLPFWPWGNSTTDSGASLAFYLFKRDQKLSIPSAWGSPEKLFAVIYLDPGWVKTTQELSEALGCAWGWILKLWSSFALFSHKEILQEELSVFLTAGLVHRAKFSIRHTGSTGSFKNKG